MMARRVVVVGGGVVGLCSAYFLAKEGIEVTVLERDSVDHHGCSWGNAGLIVPSHFVPLAAPGMVAMGLKMMFNPQSPFAFNLMGDWSLASWAKQFLSYATKEHVDRTGPIIRDLNLYSKQCYSDLREEFGDSFGFEKTGLVMLCGSSETFEHEVAMAETAREMNLKAEVWDGNQLVEKGLGVDVAAKGAVYFADDGHLTPGVFLDKLRVKLEGLGVKVLGGKAVTGFMVDHGRVSGVMVGDEDFVADDVVLAAGSWSKELGGHLGLTLPLVPGKGYSFSVEDPPAELKLPFLLVEARVAVTPMTQGVRFGGTMELGSWSEKVNGNRLKGIKKSIPGYMPQFNQTVLSKTSPVWSGLRPCLPDGLPAIGSVGPGSNLYVATGHAMMGLSLGPGTGRLVADLVVGRKPALPLHALSPHRFSK